MVPRDAQNGNKWLYNDEKTNFHLALIAALWKGGSDRPWISLSVLSLAGC